MQIKIKTRKTLITFKIYDILNRYRTKNVKSVYKYTRGIYETFAFDS